LEKDDAPPLPVPLAMLSRRSVIVYILIAYITASPARNVRLPEPAFPPESSIDTPKSLGIFDSSFAEWETCSVLLKYACSGDYLAGIGLNPDDVVPLVDRYIPDRGHWQQRHVCDDGSRRPAAATARTTTRAR